MGVLFHQRSVKKYKQKNGDLLYQVKVRTHGSTMGPWAMGVGGYRQGGRRRQGRHGGSGRFQENWHDHFVGRMQVYGAASILNIP